ncbi:energy-coupling factor ABC transporter ATP-binding protein [Anaerovorax odorimutans]|uniref:energy-coupling factor ABC transporter ATP-binding protein n=1 Tax=Anaerovorax odorimutans TaxID=109327 RepID=UPI000417CF7F|nr:ABC transporter ATP-binding protein [Anaerovorax odorimutans]
MKSETKNNAVVIRGLTYQYRINGSIVLKNIEFCIPKGEFTLVTGLSGCGKSTLCLCISGADELMNPDGILTGEVIINGKDIHKINAAERALEVGIVFQNMDTQLFSFTVEDEIAFAPENLCLPPEKIKERVDYLLNLLGIEYLRESHPHRLSGGEKSLVVLAAVLALDPPVVIMDEVMSQLDKKSKMRVIDVIRMLCDMGKTIIAVEHDIKAIESVHHIMVLQDGKLKSFRDLNGEDNTCHI